MDLPITPFIKYLYPFLIALIIVEYLRARHLYDFKETVSSFAIAIGATIIASFTKVWALGVFIVIFEFFKEFRLQLFGYESLGWGWYVWIIAMIADDHNFYWHHRLSHNIRLLWAAHVPHHNAERFNLGISIRNGWFITFYKPIFWLWMPLVGFEPVMVGTALIVNAAYQFFLHSQLVPSLGWYEKIFNTPYIHQVHHSSNVEYLDKNHGGILIIWDKIYGTYQDVRKDIKFKYGVIHAPKNKNPVEANMYEFKCIWKDMKKSPRLIDKLRYIFDAPGWSHDNSSKTAKQLQQELQMAKVPV